MMLGNGVPKDDAEAVRWYRLAAEQGNAEAQFELGYMYDQGDGLYLKTRPRPCAGTAWPPSRETPRHSSNSVTCMTKATGCLKTRPRPCAGTAWPPSRDTAY